ncbi:MAG: hypothetical protein HYY04_15820 [Chloroflexi bacterium]|nr:hypothetical protein [Chloroflexota bacterium]
MRYEFWQQAVQDLPSVRRFLTRVAEDLQAGNSVAVLLPPGIPDGLVWEWLGERLRRRDRLAAVWDARSSGCVPPCPAALASAILGEAGSGARLGELLVRAEFPDVVRIVGIGDLPPPRQREWSALTQAWVRESAHVVGRLFGSRSICLIEPAATLPDGLASGASNLVAHWWWGFPSAAELRVLCRELLDSGGVKASWVECLIAGVAPGDLALAATLWETQPEHVGDLEKVLREVSQARRSDQVNRGIGQACLGTSRAGKADAPPPRIRDDWSAGRVIVSCEHGIEAHPSLLAIENERVQLTRRIWRGQAESLLPAVDRVRLRTSSFLVGRYGPTWYARLPELELGSDERERLQLDPNDAELGPIEAVLRRVGAAPDVIVHRCAVERARQVRNQLAHYQPVDFLSFRALWEEARRGG